jgi:hypothetical protein
MQTKKMSLAAIKGVLSKAEMKKIMGGSTCGGTPCLASAMCGSICRCSGGRCVPR